MTQPILQKPQQVQEIIKCGRDPIYFINNYVKIQHAKKGLISCDLYPFQEECIKQFEEHRLNIVVKARQLGLSTITAAYALWFALFRKHKNVLVIATKLTTALGFIHKIKIALEELPKWLLLTSYSPAGQSIKFGNGSKISAIATSEDAGRGEALSLLIVDECAIIHGFDQIWTGLSPTISTGGNAILISTPFGVGGQYYKMWTDAEAGVSDFNPIRLPWNMHPEHDIYWFQKETKNLTKKQVAQEFMCDFLSSGDTFLQDDDFEYLRTLRDQTAVIERAGSDHGIWIWKRPEMNHTYVVGADVARGDSNDYSTFHVVDSEGCEVVAEYKGKVPPDKFAELLIDIGTKYNNALLCPENNTFGYTTCVRLRDLAYPHLYYSDMKNDAFTYYTNDKDRIPGFNTQTKSRIQILSKLEELIRNRVLQIYSPRFYEEVKTFVWNGVRAQASKDANDDLVLSLAIAVWILDTTVGLDVVAQETSIAMLKSMSTFKRNIADSPLATINQGRHPTPISPQTSHAIGLTNGQNGKTGLTAYPNADFSWLMK